MILRRSAKFGARCRPAHLCALRDRLFDSFSRARASALAHVIQARARPPTSTYFLNIGSSAFPALRIYATRSWSSSGFKLLIRPGGIIERLYGFRDLIAAAF